MKRLITLAFCIIVTMQCAWAQTWQWGKRGGSSDASGSNGFPENVIDIANDPKGNVYVLSITNQYGLNIDGHTKTGYGYNDATIASFSCNGTFRWTKTIGSYGRGKGYAIKTDALGGVYVIGALSSTNSFGYAHFDTDTSLGYDTRKLYLIKYDTSGNYKWLRWPEADTVTNSLNYCIDLQVDAAGNCYWLTRLAPGAFGGGSFVNTTAGVYVLKYNASGGFLGSISLPIQGALPDVVGGTHMARSTSGKFYIVGSNVTLNGTNYPKPFVAALSALGSVLWAKQGSGNMAIENRPALDGSARLYVTGAIFNGDTFNGYTSTQSGIFGAPYVTALDTGTGGPIWITYATSNASSVGRAIVSKGSEVMIAGEYPGKLKWLGATDSFNLASNSAYNVFVARFNATNGTYVRQDSLSSPTGYDEFPTAITVDRNGNYFVGGKFDAQIKVAGITLTSTGGESDFFIAKYGVSNCNCIAPSASFNANINASTKVGTFTYTGSLPVDSVRWNFGDGTTSNQMNPTHTFASGSYNVCVTAYNSCGSHQYCNNVALAVKGFAALGSVKVYPNPANNYFTIEGAEGATATLTNGIGQRAMQFSINAKKQVMEISTLPTGMYILQLTNAQGARGTMSILKDK